MGQDYTASVSRSQSRVLIYGWVYWIAAVIAIDKEEGDFWEKLVSRDLV